MMTAVGCLALHEWSCLGCLAGVSSDDDSCLGCLAGVSSDDDSCLGCLA